MAILCRAVQFYSKVFSKSWPNVGFGLQITATTLLENGEPQKWSYNASVRGLGV
jgi:hypothetical protein